MRRSLRFLLCVCVSAILVPRVSGQTQCDASIIEAMKTHFRTSDTSIASQAVHDAACGANSSSTTITVPYAGYSNDQLAQACHNNDSQYFAQHYKELAISMLPEAAFDLLKAMCTVNGLSLKASRIQGTNQIAVSAFWSGANNVPYAYVTNFGWGPNIESCTGSLTEKRYYILKPKLGTGGLYATCIRKSAEAGKGDVGFALQTDLGTQLARAYEPHSYKLLGFYGDDVLTCSIDGNQVLSLSYFVSLDSPVKETVDLNSFLQTPGTHVLTCLDVDQIGMDGHPCWKYKYNVTKDDQLILTQQNYSCSPSSPSQPPPIPPFNITVE